MNKCKHCRTGDVIPHYRKGQKPSYYCNQCNEKYTPHKHPGDFYLTHTDRRMRCAMQLGDRNE